MARIQKHPAFDPEQIWEFFNQSDYWITADKSKVKIENIDEDHLINLIDWAKRKEDAFKDIFKIARNIGKIPVNTTIYGLKDFPLWRKVNEVAQNRGLTNLI